MSHRTGSPKCVRTAGFQQLHGQITTILLILGSGVFAFADNRPDNQPNGNGDALQGQFRDPGLRIGTAGAGGAVPGLSAAEASMFNSSRLTFQEVDGTAEGLGPRFNLDSCAGCHAFPAVGGVVPR